MLQYTEGITLYQSVLDTNRQLITQQDTYAQARGNIATNLIAVYRSLGGGWELRKEREFIPETMATEMAARTDWGDLLERQPRSAERLRERDHVIGQ